MVTLFTTTKPFKPPFDVIQLNALESWRALGADVEILVFGDESGTEQMARQVDARHIPEIDSTDSGTPLISAMFMKAQELATYDIVVFMNADIILMPDFLEALGNIEKDKFLLAGERWDVDLDGQSIDFQNPSWQTHIRRRVNECGKLHGPSGMDYFAFPKGMFKSLSPFAVGRPGWDSWLMCYTLRNAIPTIDATASIMVIHQNHDYSHLSNGNHEYKKGEDTQRNYHLTEENNLTCTLRDTNFVMTDGSVRRTLRYPLHRWRRLRITNPSLSRILGPTNPLIHPFVRLIGYFTRHYRSHK